MENELLVRDDAYFAYWTIARPQARNALSSHLAERMHKELDRLEKSALQNKRALFISAQVHKQSSGKPAVWIAGGDLSELSRASKQDAKRYAKLYAHLCQRLARFPLLVVMVINGDAMGGGAEFLLSGDLRIATEESRVEFKQLVLGLPTGYSSANRLVSLVGLSKAQQLLFMPEPIGAQTALEMGLFTEMVPAAALDQRLEAIKNSLKSFDPSAIAAQKKMFDRTVGLRDDQALIMSADVSDFGKVWRNGLHARNLDAWVKRK